MLRAVPTLPKVTTVHGWTLAATTEAEWAQYLLTLPSIQVPLTFPCVSPVWDLFVGGSCFWPEHEAFRAAAWSVVVAPPLHLDPNPAACQVLQAQPASGLSQTFYRAELTALVAALTFVAQSPRWVRIWSDCEAGVNKFHLLTSGKVCVKVNGKHSDLWLEVVRLVELINLKHIRVIKVPAHEDISMAATSFDEWICVANSVADRAAKAANRNRMGNFWALWERHVGQTLKMRILGVQIRDHILGVGMRWVSKFKDRNSLVVLPVRKLPREARTPLEKRATKLFGRSFAMHMVEWIETWVDSSIPARLQWISFAQLFILDQLDMGNIPVVKQGKIGWWLVKVNFCFLRDVHSVNC